MRFLQGPPCIPKHTEANCSAYTIHQRGPRGNLEEQNPQLFSFLKCFEVKERKGPQPTGTASGREPQTPLPPGGQSLSRRTRSRWTREGRNASGGRTQRVSHQQKKGRPPAGSNGDEPGAPGRVSGATCPHRKFREIPLDHKTPRAERSEAGAWPAPTAWRTEGQRCGRGVAWGPLARRCSARLAPQGASCPCNFRDLALAVLTVCFPPGPPTPPCLI